MRTEAQEQELVMQWAALSERLRPELRLLFHIPNGGSRNRIEALHLKKQGVKPGVPDLFLPAPREGWAGLFLEMKREKGGRVSDEQKQWIGDLLAAGYAVRVCRGFDEAKDAIEQYLNGSMRKEEEDARIR